MIYLNIVIVKYIQSKMYFIYGTGWSWLPRPTQGASPAASLDGRWPRNVGGEATHKPPLTHLFLHNNNTLQIWEKFLRVKPISFDMRTFHASDGVDACCKWDEIHCLNNTNIYLWVFSKMHQYVLQNYHWYQFIWLIITMRAKCFETTKVT